MKLVACCASFSLVLTGLSLSTAAAAVDSPFSRLEQLFAAAARPTLQQIPGDETWAGKCAVVDAPNALAGATENFFRHPDPVLGDRVWAIDTLHEGDEGWPTRVSAMELAAERRRAEDGLREYSALAETETALWSRDYRSWPGGQVDNIYYFRLGASESGTPLWLVRVDCNLNVCIDFGGRGPAVGRGDAIGYCYFDHKVLPVPGA